MFSKRLLALARSSNLALTLTIVLGFLGGLLTILQETGFPCPPGRMAGEAIAPEMALSGVANLSGLGDGE
jgi:hypothetical protein